MRQKIKGLRRSSRLTVRRVGFRCGGREQFLYGGGKERLVRKPETRSSDLRWSVYELDV